MRSALPKAGSDCYISAVARGYPRLPFDVRLDGSGPGAGFGMGQMQRFNAGWSSPVARQAHNLKVVGSNPTPATTDSLTPGLGVGLSRFWDTSSRIEANS